MQHGHVKKNGTHKDGFSLFNKWSNGFPALLRHAKFSIPVQSIGKNAPVNGCTNNHFVPNYFVDFFDILNKSYILLLPTRFVIEPIFILALPRKKIPTCIAQPDKGTDLESIFIQVLFCIDALPGQL